MLLLYVKLKLLNIFFSKQYLIKHMHKNVVDKLQGQLAAFKCSPNVIVGSMNTLFKVIFFTVFKNG